jgi:hypothetical protein
MLAHPLGTSLLMKFSHQIEGSNNVALHVQQICTEINYDVSGMPAIGDDRSIGLHTRDILNVKIESEFSAVHQVLRTADMARSIADIVHQICDVYVRTRWNRIPEIYSTTVVSRFLQEVIEVNRQQREKRFLQRLIAAKRQGKNVSCQNVSASSDAVVNFSVSKPIPILCSFLILPCGFFI